MWSGCTFISTMIHVYELHSGGLAASSCSFSLQAIEAAFSHTVKTVCQSGVPLSPEVSPELQMLKASAALGRLVAKSCPDLRAQIFDTMNAFITRNLGGWITQQGGWVGLSLITHLITHYKKNHTPVNLLSLPFHMLCVPWLSCYTHKSGEETLPLP